MKRPSAVYFFTLIAIPVAALAADFKFFEPLNPPRPFQVMVHRGEADQAPENTRPALQRCVEDLFEWAEVDVRLTKDHQHVLCHDSASPAAGRYLAPRPK